MAATDPRETSDADLDKGRERSIAELNIPASQIPVNPDSRTGSSGRRLDVDAVLERSVRKVVKE